MDNIFASIQTESTTEINTADTGTGYGVARELYWQAVEEEARRLLNDPNIDTNEADARFSTALNLEKLRSKSVVIIGAGGLGNWQWRIILGMGFRDVTIYDDDVIGIENVGSQGHSLLDMDTQKVSAVQQAALAYRGIRITARPIRVTSYEHLLEDLGRVPDIVITCTDSAEFRNRFINNIQWDYSLEVNRLPELLLDYRMSLGDWNCYAIPCRDLYRHGKSHYLHLYAENACFRQEDAVQDACTERGIIYTGANAASYTGAFLHWWLTSGRQLFGADGGVEAFFCTSENRMQFQWLMSYSSRDWEQISQTSAEYKLSKAVQKSRNACAGAEQKSTAFLHYLLGESIEEIPFENAVFGDFVFTNENALLRVLVSTYDQNDSLYCIALDSCSLTVRSIYRKSIIAVYSRALHHSAASVFPLDALFKAVPGIDALQAVRTTGEVCNGVFSLTKYAQILLGGNSISDWNIKSIEICPRQTSTEEGEPLLDFQDIQQGMRVRITALGEDVYTVAGKSLDGLDTTLEGSDATIRVATRYLSAGVRQVVDV